MSSLPSTTSSASRNSSKSTPPPRPTSRPPRTTSGARGPSASARARHRPHRVRERRGRPRRRACPAPATPRGSEEDARQSVRRARTYPRWTTHDRRRPRAGRNCRRARRLSRAARGTESRATLPSGRHPTTSTQLSILNPARMPNRSLGPRSSEGGTPPRCSRRVPAGRRRPLLPRVLRSAATARHVQRMAFLRRGGPGRG